METWSLASSVILLLLIMFCLITLVHSIPFDEVLDGDPKPVAKLVVSIITIILTTAEFFLLKHLWRGK